jgi:hypothetical protein
MSVHSRDRITERLKEAGLQLRPHNPAIRRALSHNEVVQLIQKMRGKGKPYRHIAKELMKLKIETKAGKTQWHPMMVKRLVLKRKN